MSIKWDLYKTRLEINGTSLKDRQVNSVVDAINNDFKSSPSFFEVSINGGTTLTGVQIVDNSTNAANKVDYIRKIIMKPSDSISVGDIVDWDSKKWLVISAEKFSDLYWYGMMQECNNTLKFYKKQNQTSILFEVPCIFSDGSVSLEEGRFLSLPSGHYLITIPSGYIAKSDMNMRYIINDAPYKTFGINNATNGLVKIEVVDDSFNEKDDKINSIAWNIDNPQHNYTIDILNGAEQTIKYGESLTLNIQVKDFGDIVSPTPSLLFESSNGTICTVNQNGVITATNDSGSAIVTVRLASDTNISSSIEIDASPASQTNYTYTLIGNIQPDTQLNFNQTKTYVATKYDGSNNIIASQFLFQVVGDTPSSKYVLTKVNDNECTLKCMGYPYTIILRAIDINNSQYIDKIISFKSLM